MIRYYAKHNGQLTELDKPESNCWINISAPFSHEEIEGVSQEFDVPLDFLTDSLDIDERSRYEREEGVRLIVLNTPLKNEKSENNEALYITVPIGIILVDNYMITITSYENPILQMFLADRVKNFNPNDESAFVLSMMEQNVYRFLTCLKKLNLKRNTIEKKLYDSSSNSDLRELLSVEKSLVYFVNTLSSNELLKMKMKRSDFLAIRTDEDKADLFEDIIIDNSQALEMANVHTRILNGTMEAYASIISNNLNMVMQRLTLVTVILMVPTLVASFFGMNVPVPFDQGGETPFYAILIFAILISLLMAWWFRRKSLF